MICGEDIEAIAEHPGSSDHRIAIIRIRYQVREHRNT